LQATRRGLCITNAWTVQSVIPQRPPAAVDTRNRLAGEGTRRFLISTASWGEGLAVYYVQYSGTDGLHEACHAILLK